MNFDDLTDEQKESVRACRTPQEILELANQAGYELSDEQLAAISGGDWDCWTICSSREECTRLCVAKRMPMG